MNESDIRERIVESVRERGYLDSWTSRQLVARNACKLVEEAAETLEACRSRESAISSHAEMAKADAGELFDDGDLWGYFDRMDVEQVKSEVADCYVTLSVLLDALEAVTGKPFDVAQAALGKAEGDVERGIR